MRATLQEGRIATWGAEHLHHSLHHNVNGGPAAPAALNSIPAIPFTVSAGKRKFTWNPSTAPGKPTAPRTMADLPFTLTSTSELTAASGIAGNAWPSATAGSVGPRPVAKSANTSPAVAGLDAVTRVKLFEWVTAAPLPVTTICGVAIVATQAGRNPVAKQPWNTPSAFCYRPRMSPR